MNLSKPLTIAAAVVITGVFGAGPASAAKPTPGPPTDKQVAQTCKKLGGTIYFTPTRTAYECDYATRATITNIDTQLVAQCSAWGGSFFEYFDNAGQYFNWTCVGKSLS